MEKITSFISRDVTRQVQKLYNQGGPFQKAAEKVKSIIYDVEKKTLPPKEILSKISLTNHGESRIKHCIKYDLQGACRLVTIQNENYIVLIYLGTHDEVDEWLDKNKGLQLGITDLEKGLFEVFLSTDITDSDNRISLESDYSEGQLFSKLKHYYPIISRNLKSYIRKGLEGFTTVTSEDDILELAQAIDDGVLQDVVFDVFILLRGGKVDEAKNRILQYENELSLIDELALKDIEELKSNDFFLRIDDLDPSDMKVLMHNHEWLDWMLFMHPAQKKVVDRDFSGSARLIGVSGSGKTCVIVRRAIRMAQKYDVGDILILTLNESLAKLIRKLLGKLLAASSDEVLENRIKVKSFAELCRDLILELHPEKHKQLKMLNFKTHKHENSIDEVWKEYYTCLLHNNDAKVFFPIHQQLLARSVFPQEYLKQEVDWIRSYFTSDDRIYYLKAEREGRSIPFVDTDRKNILDGLKYWEQKMKDVGVIDYLGLANLLANYSSQITPKYRCILVDEVQDFGTLELKLVRKLVADNENDLFIAGDIAQQVYNKHHRIKHAGITILPGAWMKILKNYRNSREILEAAHSIYSKNVDSQKLATEDFEVLNPEFANFSSPKPFLRKADSLNDEFNSAHQYLTELLSGKEKGCIAFCGYSIFEVSAFGKANKIQVLDDDIDLEHGQIFISDLEQTKGFEFDKMIIINCNEGIIPNPILPKEEWFREVSKIYVAMTRAKKELVLSYSKKLSNFFLDSLDYFKEDLWSTHIKSLNENHSLPDSNIEIFQQNENWKINGKEFLYDRRAVGISRELQNKLLETVYNKSVYNERGKIIGWSTLENLKNDLSSRTKDVPTLTKIFGPVVLKELEELLKT